VTAEGGVEAAASLVPVELRQRLSGLGSRPWIDARLEQWLRGPARYFILSGGPGTGKTMQAVRALAGAGVPVGLDPWVAAHFCSNRLQGYSRHPRQLISNLQQRLSARYPEVFLPGRPELTRPLIELAGSVRAESVAGTAVGVNLTIGQLTAAPLSIHDFFQVAVVEPLTRLAVSAPGTTVGLVIDGLDEAATFDGPNIITLLHEYAASLPPVCKVLVTSQNTPAVLDRLLAAVSDLVALDLSDPRHRAAVDDDVHRFVRARAGVRAVDGDLPERITRAVAGNFLHAEGILSQEVSSGSAADRPDLGGYYHALFDRLRDAADAGAGTGSGTWERHCLPLLHHLAVARAPRRLDSLGEFLGWDAATLARSLQAIRPVLVLDEQRETAHLEHQATAAFLLDPVLPGARVNRHAARERTVQAALVARVTELLDTAWAGSWGSADAYSVEHTAAHLQRLRALDDADRPVAGLLRAASRSRVDGKVRAADPSRVDGWSSVPRAGGSPPPVSSLRLADLAAEIAAAPDRLADAQAAMATVLRFTARRGDAAEYEAAATVAAASSDPFIRTAVLDSIPIDLDPPRARKVVLRLLGRPGRRQQAVGISAIARLDAESRARTVRWIATKAPEDLRRYAGYALYLLAGQDAPLAARTFLDPVVDAVSLLHPGRSRRAVDFLANVSITAYANNCDDPEVALATSALWHRIILDRLRINLVNRPVLESPIVAVTARRLAARIVGNAAFRPEVPALDATDQALVQALLPGLTPNQDLARLAGPMQAGFAARAWTPRILSACVTMVQAISDPGGSEAVLTRLFEEGAGPSRIWQVAAYSVLIRATPPEWVPRLQRMYDRTLTENPVDVDSYLAGDDAELDFFSIATPLAYAKHGVSMAEPFCRLAGAAGPVLRRSLFRGLAVVGLYYPVPALSTVHRVVTALGSALVREQVAGVLSRIRLMHPGLVDVLARDLGMRLAADPGAESELDFAWRHVDALGLYNNAVHQAIHYPRMRTALLLPGFAGLAAAGSPEEFIRGYAPRVLRLARDTNYELTGWMQ
jgi:hypothetical protein